MDLRRRRGPGIWLLVLGLLALLLVPNADPTRTVLVLVLAAVLLVTGALSLLRRRGFRFHISTTGLDLAGVSGITRTLRWEEIDALVLDQPPAQEGVPQAARLMLVPAGSGDLGVPLSSRSPVDGRPALILLDVNHVRDSPDKMAQGLARFAGSRFTDCRQRHPSGFAIPEFTVALRGYEMSAIDRLLRHGQEALASEDPEHRAKIRAEIEEARSTLLIALRGYDRTQVSAALDELDAALTATSSNSPPQ